VKTVEQHAIERELEIAATPETVWELLTDPHEVTRWMGQRATFDLRSGGEYRVEVIPGHTARGEFVEIDPPNRLVFTWGWEGGANVVAPGSTTVEFELARHGDGTRLRFRHLDLPSAESVTSHTHGWELYLDRLARAAGGEDPGADPWLTGSME
jgi:uncharacterized protein YndB with AHSA1/START domain